MINLINDLLPVTPINKPSGLLYYIDYVYVDKVKERNKKLKKILKNINESTNNAKNLF